MHAHPRCATLLWFRSPSRHLAQRRRPSTDVRTCSLSTSLVSTTLNRASRTPDRRAPPARHARPHSERTRTVNTKTTRRRLIGATLLAPLIAWSRSDQPLVEV